MEVVGKAVTDSDKAFSATTLEGCERSLTLMWSGFSTIPHTDKNRHQHFQ